MTHSEMQLRTSASRIRSLNICVELISNPFFQDVHTHMNLEGLGRYFMVFRQSRASLDKSLEAGVKWLSCKGAMSNGQLGMSGARSALGMGIK